MNDKTIIETARIRIVPFSEEHLTERYVQWLNDPEVVRYSDQRFRSHSIESCREYWKSFQGSDNYFWALVANDSSIGHFGNMNAYVDTRHSVVDVGILLGERSLWGKGYGSEAWIGVLGYLLRDKGFRKVTAGTLSVNHGMLKIMERSGMVSDGVRQRQYVFEGTPVDMVHAAAFRDQWKEPHSSRGST